MYLWSWTFLILPVVAIAVGIGAFFAIKAIARKVKRKAAAQNALKQSQGKQKDQEKQQEKETVIQKEQLKAPATTSQEITAQQTNPIANPQVDKQTTDIVAPQPKLSDAEYVKQSATLPFDAKDNAIVLGDKQKHTEWLVATKKLNDPKSSDEVRAQAEAELQALNKYFENTYGHIPTMPSPANFAASVKDENNKTVYDFRNYCFDGYGAQTFKKACEEEYNAQDGDDMPTIFQVDNNDNPSHPSLIVSSTQTKMFFAGVDDIKSAIKAQKMKNFTLHLITDANGRQLISQEGTLSDIDKFIKDGIYTSAQKDNLEK